MITDRVGLSDEADLVETFTGITDLILFVDRVHRVVHAATVVPASSFQVRRMAAAPGDNRAAMTGLSAKGAASLPHEYLNGWN